jgi:cytochrome b6-f complex iron-sulfur subunit
MEKHALQPSPVTTTNAASRNLSRRDFLSIVWKSLLGLSGLLGLGGLARFFSYQTDPPPVTSFDLGLADNFPPGSHEVINDADAVVFHLTEGFKALSLVCPHLGCIVETSASGYTCPCHGSQFDPDGALVHGPADRGLRMLQVKVNEEGHLILDTSQDLGSAN